MTNIEYPRLCGGTFMTLVIQALLQRKKAREHYKGESDKLNDPDVLVGLITVINPDYEDPGKAVLKTKANDYKSCKLSTDSISRLETSWRLGSLTKGYEITTWRPEMTCASL